MTTAHKRPEINHYKTFYITSMLSFAISVSMAIFSHGLIGGWAMIGAIALSIALLVSSIIFTKKGQDTIAKLIFIGQVILATVMVLAFIFHKIGIFEATSSIEEMREFIEQFGYAKYTFIAVQFFQVLFLPIPTTVTMIAGLLLFKPWQVVYYTMIGVIPGSIIMFLLGKYAGRRVVDWLLGKEEVDKYLELIKGKDVSILTALFLLPFLPDDTLCAVAGISTMSIWYFIPLILITRIIMCLANVFMFGSGAIPLHGWGLLVWGTIAVASAVMLYIVFKKGDVLQEKILKLTTRKKK